MTDSEPLTTAAGAPPTPPPSAVDSDTTAVPVATTPAEPAGAGDRPPQSRVRWIAAGGAIALVILVTALAAIVLTSSTPSSVVLGYVPTDSVAYGEMRFDLPGDQRQKVGQFLSKFPGFADQAALETKLDEVLDRLISEGSQGKQTFTRDVKPWFGGQLGFAIGPIPDVDPNAPMSSTARGVLLVTVKDEALARAWFTNTLGQAGVTGTSETYQGTELTLFASPDAPTKQAAFALAGGKVAIVGDVASVKAAIDTKGSSALAKGPGVAAAQAALTGDDLGFMFLDTKALFEASTRVTGSLSSASPLSSAITSLIPDWAAMRIRVEADALQLDAVTQHKAGMPGPDQNRANGVAAFAPPSTVALLAGNDYGRSLLDWIELYRSEPTLADAFAQIDQAAGMLGGLEALLSWMGDTGVVIAKSGDSVEGGVVSVPADPSGGRQLLTTIRSFLQLGGAQAGVTIRDEQYLGETITVIDLGDLRDLAAMAGGIGSLPTDPSSLPEGRAQIAYVATDEVIAIGSSADFIKHVLDAGAGASLADDARFKGLLGRVDAENTGVTFVDIAAIRGLAEGAMSSATDQQRTEYEASIKPFLTPFDALISTGAVGGELAETHTLITVK
ncbi:MAG TPA: DUF3352 domain-containing protein [Candidatus Limnocylindrales bacterium]|nr:DUF3352 domain-containing protein [Candidatus Limnocylindrales bacterium]